MLVGCMIVPYDETQKSVRWLVGFLVGLLVGPSVKISLNMAGSYTSMLLSEQMFF